MPSPNMQGLSTPARDKPPWEGCTDSLINGRTGRAKDRCEVPNETQRSFNDEIANALLVLKLRSLTVRPSLQVGD